MNSVKLLIDLENTLNNVNNQLKYVTISNNVLALLK